LGIKRGFVNSNGTTPYGKNGCWHLDQPALRHRHPIKVANNGASKGMLWNCTPTNQEWSGRSTISGRAPSGFMPLNSSNPRLQRGLVVDADLVAVAVTFAASLGGIATPDVAVAGDGICAWHQPSLQQRLHTPPP